MAANPSKGDYGKLIDHKARHALLLAHINAPLKEVAKLLGVGTERARQLYWIYRVPRVKRKHKPAP